MLIAITAALLVLMGLYVRDLFAPRRGSVPASAEEALKLDAEGTVSVSSQAMESLVNQTVGHIEGVASYETRVNGDTEFLTVDIYLTVMSGTRVPELSESLKKALAEELESLAGVKKTEVHLLISDVVKMKLQ